VFENRVSRRIFGPKREEVAGGWRRLHSEELHNLYASQGIVGVIEWRMRWAGHIVCMGQMRNAKNILVENLKRRDHSKDLGVDGEIMLE
jgi:hypothetical protein